MKKFAVKIHNKYLSEAVQKLAKDSGYTSWGVEYPATESELYFDDKTFTWFSPSYIKDSFPKVPVYDALTDWTKIEEAMKPKEPRVIWVRSCDKLAPDSKIVFEHKDKPTGYGSCCSFTKFQEVIE